MAEDFRFICHAVERYLRLTVIITDHVPIFTSSKKACLTTPSIGKDNDSLIRALCYLNRSVFLL